MSSRKFQSANDTVNFLVTNYDNGGDHNEDEDAKSQVVDIEDQMVQEQQGS